MGRLCRLTLLVASVYDGERVPSFGRSFHANRPNGAPKWQDSLRTHPLHTASTPAEGLPLRTWPRKSGESGRGGGSRGTSPSSGVHTRTSGIATLRAVSVGGPDTPSLQVIAAAGGGGSRRREAGTETTGAKAPRGRRQRRIQERGRALFSPRGRRGSPTEPGTLVTMSVFTK